VYPYAPHMLIRIKHFLTDNKLYPATIFIVVFLITIASSSCTQDQKNSIEYTSGEIPQEVYVWQRVWTQDVQSAVENRSVEFNKTVFLAAEISYQSRQWTCQPYHAPLTYSQQHPQHSGLAFRINSNAAHSNWSHSDIEQVSQFLHQHAHHVNTIQIDYDCPSLKLKDYTKLLHKLRLDFPKKSLEITCLPDWLNYHEFTELVQHTDRYVMQVHGVSGHGVGQVLCDTEHAYQTALKCAELGKPFLIALPTYRHAINYDKEGKISSVASEGNFQSSNYEIVRADPHKISQLVDTWRKQRPTLMQAIIWYRLPVTSDKMNWTWSTFKKVTKGIPVDRVKAEITLTPDQNGAHQLRITNSSEQHIDWPDSINIKWQGFIIANQLTEKYSLKKLERSKGATLSLRPILRTSITGKQKLYH